ncbi:integrin alpha [Myxococcota bacterium]
MEKDALKVHVDNSTKTHVMNRKNIRAFFINGNVSFVSTGVSINEVDQKLKKSSTENVWAVRYRLTGMKYNGRVHDLGVRRTSYRGSIVTIEHDEILKEEYENKPDSIEQKFVIRKDVGSDFVLRGVVEGSVDLQLSDIGLSVLSRGEEILHATAPRAFDAEGREIDARFVIEPGRLDIAVSGASAFPVLVDPAWSSSGDDQQGAAYGVSVSSAGDVNGDGFDDVIVGASSFSTTNLSAGKAYLYLGYTTGLSITPVWTSSGDDQQSAGYGFSVSSAGDVDNDGFDDFIVGAFGYDKTGTNEGKAYLYLGSDTGLSTTPVWTSSGDDREGSIYGRSVSSAGDINGDGFDDIIVGAPYYDATNSMAGKAYLYLGSDTGLSTTPAWTSSGDDKTLAFYGYSVSSAGDVNGDGFDEIVIGSYLYDTTNDDAGKAYLYHGSDTGLSATPDWVSYGDNEFNAGYGYSVSSAGDVNGDGFDDVIVGAYNYDTTNNAAGKAYLYPGSDTGLSTIPAWSSSGDDNADSNFGYSVSSAGDVNGDGFDDVIVGASSYDTTNTNAGKAYLYLGSDTGLSTTPSWISSGDDQASAWYGSSVSSAGDVNGDGFDDCIVGAYGCNSYAGKAYLYLGFNGPSGLCDPPGTPCDDGDACTMDDACNNSGICAGMQYTCNDTNPCTDDVCNGDGTCSYPNNTVSCDDSDACTVGDVCSGGTCISGVPIDCDDGVFCTDDICDTDTGLCSNPNKTNGTLCNDGNNCSTLDTCQSGVCTAGATNKDTDGDTYLDGNCPGGSDCDDGNGNVNPAATEGPFGNPTCSDTLDNDCDTLTDLNDTECMQCTTPADCDDGNVCTADSCISNVCQNNAVSDGTPCNDGDLCTQTDTCQSGACTGVDPVFCTALDQCHDAGTCNPGTGICTDPPKTDGTACDDGLYCNVGETCQAGSCTGGSARDCGDGDICTQDACDEANDACTHLLVPNPGAEGPAGDTTCGDSLDNDCDRLTDVNDPDCQNCTLDSECDDGNACTQGDTCTSGMCTGSGVVKCTAHDECHDVGVCDPVTGCSNPEKPDGTACTSGICQSGVCVPEGTDGGVDGGADAGQDGGQDAGADHGGADEGEEKPGESGCGCQSGTVPTRFEIFLLMVGLVFFVRRRFARF